MNLSLRKYPCGDSRPRLSSRAKLDSFLSPRMKFDSRETL
jgi:hypothetical protein